MTRKRSLYLSVAAICLAGCFIWSQPRAQTAVAIDKTDIGGVVTGPNGPEAGVWVIAETNDLPTRFAKIVVTDDQGRYVVPDLPKANYTVWVRGYGLVDSPKVEAEPGKHLNLTAVPAPNAAAAAQVLSGDLLVLDAEDSGRRPVRRQERHSRQGQADRLAQRHEEQRLRRLPSARQARDPHDPEGFGDFKTSEEAWTRRIQSGQAGELMVNIIAGQLGAAPLNYFADWTDRIAKGELPHAKPQRPQGVERNVVITTWDWSDEKHYLHDLISTDKRNPTVNGYGPLFGAPEYAPTTSRSSIRSRTASRPSRRRCATPTCRSRSDPATPRRSSRWRRRPIGATSRSGTPGSTTTIR